MHAKLLLLLFLGLASGYRFRRQVDLSDQLTTVDSQLSTTSPLGSTSGGQQSQSLQQSGQESSQGVAAEGADHVVTISPQSHAVVAVAGEGTTRLQTEARRRQLGLQSKQLKRQRKLLRQQEAQLAAARYTAGLPLSRKEEKILRKQQRRRRKYNRYTNAKVARAAQATQTVVLN